MVNYKLKLAAYIVLVFASCNIYAQNNTFPASGNVGIGTTSPDKALSVVGDINAIGYIGGGGTYNNVLKILPLVNAPDYFYIDTNIPATDLAAPQIHLTGYAYGSSNKAVKLTIGWYYYFGNFHWTQWQSDLGYYKPSRIRLGVYNKAGSNYIRLEIANDDIYFANYSVSATDAHNYASSFYSGWSYTEGTMPPETTSQVVTVAFKEEVSVHGKLGIGVLNPTERLEVNGKIRAKEVKVEATNWPDYVFAPDYTLPDLKETERFIKKNGRLPEIPSAKEVVENGIHLGEMNAKLLQKIEELTLYIIAIKKENEEQQKEIDKLKN